MAQIDNYPGEVVEINGTATGPWPPAPASTFTYTVDVCMPGGMVRKYGCRPNVERWPEQMEVNPIRIGTLVQVYVIGDKVVLGDRELPNFRECPPPGRGRSSTTHTTEFAATAEMLTPEQVARVRKALGL